MTLSSARCSTKAPDADSASSSAVVTSRGGQREGATTNSRSPRTRSRERLVTSTVRSGQARHEVADLRRGTQQVLEVVQDQQQPRVGPGVAATSSRRVGPSLPACSSARPMVASTWAGVGQRARAIWTTPSG